MAFTNSRSSAVSVSFTVTDVDTGADALSEDFELTALSVEEESDRKTFDGIEYETEYEISVSAGKDSGHVSSSQTFMLPDSTYGFLIDIADDRIEFDRSAP